jgi:hypothetical protein
VQEIVKELDEEVKHTQGKEILQRIVSGAVF